MKKQQICILGSTGSIGTQALDVIEQHSDLYEVYCLTANNRVQELAEQARNYTGREVFFPRHLSDSDGENMTWAEIIGFQLVDAVSGKLVGTLDRVDDSTLNLLFEVTTPEGDDILIPASNDLIEEVNAEKKEIRMAIPEGLLDL